VSDIVYSRAPDVVWRLAPDRVLVRRIGHTDEQLLEVLGDAALVWLALDEPATEQEISERLVGADITDSPTGGIRLLIDSKLVVRSQPGGRAHA
jgi:hypothetical protein